MFRAFQLFTIALVSVGLAGCGSEPTSLLVSTPTRIVLPTVTTASLPTQVPTATRAVVPTQAPTTAPTIASPTRTRTATPGTMKIKLFFVALEDNGKSGKQIGCNDSIVAVTRTIPATTAPLTAALKELFSIRERNYGQAGLYNALAPANLKLDSASLIDGKATINLSGTLELGGVCDAPRVEAQLKELALQFSTVKQVSVFLNGIPLEKALSGKSN